MARKILVPSPAPGTRNPAYAAAVLTTSDFVNNHQWPSQDHDMLIVVNTGASTTHEVIMVAGPNKQGRGLTGADETVNLAPGGIAIYGPLLEDGWVQTGTALYKVNSDDNPQEIEFAILRGVRFRG